MVEVDAEMSRIRELTWQRLLILFSQRVSDLCQTLTGKLPIPTLSRRPEIGSHAGRFGGVLSSVRTRYRSKFLHCTRHVAPMTVRDVSWYCYKCLTWYAVLQSAPSDLAVDTSHVTLATTDVKKEHSGAYRNRNSADPTRFCRSAPIL